MTRPLRPADAEELAALYLADREFLAPLEPVRPPEFFSAETQRERIAPGRPSTTSGGTSSCSSA